MKKGKFEAVVWPSGNYRAEIAQAEDTVSKSSGKPMLKLKLLLTNKQGEENTVFAYLMANRPKKLEELAVALGWPADTEDFDPAVLEGKSLDVQIGIQSSDEYGDQNSVVKFLEPVRRPAATGPLKTDQQRAQVRANDPPKPAAKRAAVEDDEIPF